VPPLLGAVGEVPVQHARAGPAFAALLALDEKWMVPLARVAGWPALIQERSASEGGPYNSKSAQEARSQRRRLPAWVPPPYLVKRQKGNGLAGRCASVDFKWVVSGLFSDRSDVGSGDLPFKGFGISGR
jgi:hypothetical protein